MSFNILLTSVGRRVELARAFNDSLEKLGLDGKIVATEIDRLAPALQAVDTGFIVPRLTDERYVPALLDICESEEIDMVVPLIDPDIPVLAAHFDELKARGATATVPPSHWIEVVEDKWRTYGFFRDVGVPTAPTWLPDDLPKDLEFPAFIKPRIGSAAEGTFKIAGEVDLDFFLTHVDEPVVQKFLRGPEITSDVLCDADGKLLSVVSRQRIEVRSGEVAKGVTVLHDGVIDGCRAVADAIRPVGPLTVQCIMDDGEPYFTEINARFAGGSPLALAAGADLPTWLVASLAGIEVDVPPLGSYRTGLYMTRYDESFVLTEEERSGAARDRL